MGIGTIIWIVTIVVAIFFVNSYAKKIQKDKSKTALSEEEIKVMHENFDDHSSDNNDFSKIHKKVLLVFGLGFVIMIFSLIWYVNTFLEGFKSNILFEMIFTYFKIYS